MNTSIAWWRVLSFYILFSDLDLQITNNNPNTGNKEHVRDSKSFNPMSDLSKYNHNHYKISSCKIHRLGSDINRIANKTRFIIQKSLTKHVY